MGAISTVKMENGKVSCETAEGTVININLSQRSALDCMLDSIKAIRMKKAGGDESPTRETGSAIPLGFGVSLISLGFISVVLAVIIAVAQPSLAISYTGAHFWVGFPFILSGVLNIVAYRHPKPCWTLLAFISMLTCLAVSIAGTVFTVGDISSFHWRYNLADQCDSLVRNVQNPDRYDNYYYRTEPPRYYNRNSYTFELENCKRTMMLCQNLLLGLVILSLLMMVWGICASAFSLGHRLKVVCTACKCEKPEEEDKDEPLLAPNPPNEVFIA